MIIIPELQTVLILTPRTGSGSLKKAVLARWPRAMLLYRHMEADGIPQGYDRYFRTGVVRQPLERLWSLYKFMATMPDGKHEPAYVAGIRRSVERYPDFSDWILHNETVFTSPYDSSNRGFFYPNHTVRHPLPENRKSQWMYLRPDLGTRIYKYGQTGELRDWLQLDDLPRENVTDKRPVPSLSGEAMDHMLQCFHWDFKVTQQESKSCAA